LPPLDDQLAARLCAFGVDPTLAQSAYVVLDQCRINNMKCPLAPVYALAYERQQEPILFIAGMEKRTNVALASQRLTAKMDRLFGSHLNSPRLLHLGGF
jgi:hypothetical protein